MDKRNTLKKLTTSGLVLGLLPNSWQRPLIKSVILPTHAQSSSVPIISNIHCHLSTPSLQVGTVITMSATLGDTNTDIESLSWNVVLNSGTPGIFGHGQLPTLTHTVTKNDIGPYVASISVKDKEGNRTYATLCEGQVKVPDPANGNCSANHIPGIWYLNITDYSMLIELFADGTGLDLPDNEISWKLIGDQLILETTKRNSKTLFHGPYTLIVTEGCIKAYSESATATSIFKNL